MRGLGPCLLVFAIGCSTPLEEGLVVNLQSDYVPVVEFATIEIAVDDGDPRRLVASSRESFERPRGIATFEGLARGVHVVAVSLERSGAVVASRRVQVELDGSLLVTVIISRACGGVSCDVGETCSGGRCVPPTCVTGMEPTCPPPGCRADGDCAASTDCVVPECAASVCLERPDHERCEPGFACVPGTGCVVRPADPDGGVAPADAHTAGPCRSAADCEGGRECCDDGSCRMSCVAGSCSGVAAGTVCRPAEGACDRAESCDGTSATCPPDELLDAGATCRASRGDCDRAERCSGTSASCPADAYEDGPVCRDAAGPCDEAERCNGRGPDCPSDEVDETSRMCRNARGPCDEPERCDGRSAQCPRDAVAASGAECRRAAGVCDVAERCDGSSTDCPPDELVSAGTVCRDASSPCGVIERCTGDFPQCPEDAHAPSSTVCRWATSICDDTEQCTGSDDRCPDDSYRPDDSYCDEACGYEVCSGGACVGGTRCDWPQPECVSDSYCSESVP